LEEALQRVLGESDCHGEPLNVTVAGRTDRGVHAWGQVATYRHEAVDPRRLNGLLPADIAVLAAEPAQENFDARRDAISRTYCYRVLARPQRSVFLRSSALWWPHDLDRGALGACADLLVGTHDFTAFTPTETEHVRFERQVLRAHWCQSGDPDERWMPAHGVTAAAQQASEPRWPAVADVLEFWIEADAFMRQMNRVLVGTMLEVASGRRTVDDFAVLLEGRPRAQAGPTAPAHGLAFAAVSYPAR
jgi:tRNA pseudouridine38-40 synthase